jgi:hypothetical protein
MCLLPSCTFLPVCSMHFLEQFADRFTLYLNCKVKSVTGNVYETTNGDQVVAELAYFCTGIQPNISVFRSHFEDSIKMGGWVSVRPTLQLDTIEEQSSVIFVAGDLIDVQEEKLAQTAQVCLRPRESVCGCGCGCGCGCQCERCARGVRSALRLGASDTGPESPLNVCGPAP